MSVKGLVMGISGSVALSGTGVVRTFYNSSVTRARVTFPLPRLSVCVVDTIVGAHSGSGQLPEALYILGALHATVRTHTLCAFTF